MLPPEPERRKGGRPRIPNRDVLRGILFVLSPGLPWEYLPPELGCGSGMTCWRRLREWHEAGVWRRLHQALISHLGEADRIHIHWSRASLDTSAVPAEKGAAKPGRIRRIAANRARNAIWWSTGKASRSR